MSMEHNAPRRTRRQRAGVFDVRAVIGLLLGIYGVVLTITGLVSTGDQDLAKTDGVNLNLWTGLSLLLASAVFLIWARVRPVLVPADNPGEHGASGTQPPAH
jgi:hypothetical protein